MDIKLKMVINPFIEYQNKPQYLSWSSLKDKAIYRFELILPFKAIMLQYRDKGYYLHLCARVIEDKKLHVSEVFKDQLITIDLPAKTFGRAWHGINYVFRNQITEDDNVRITFEKKSKQDIKIISYEKMSPTPEHLAFTTENYKQPESFKKTVVRKEEFL